MVDPERDANLRIPFASLIDALDACHCDFKFAHPVTRIARAGQFRPKTSRAPTSTDPLVRVATKKAIDTAGFQLWRMVKNPEGRVCEFCSARIEIASGHLRRGYRNNRYRDSLSFITGSGSLAGAGGGETGRAPACARKGSALCRHLPKSSGNSRKSVCVGPARPNQSGTAKYCWKWPGLGFRRRWRSNATWDCFPKDCRCAAQKAGRQNKARILGGHAWRCRLRGFVWPKCTALSLPSC
jgi:hypothetical protein